MALRKKRLFFLWQPLTEAFEICIQNSIQNMRAETPEGKDKWCELKPLEKKIQFLLIDHKREEVTPSTTHSFRRSYKTSRSPQLQVSLLPCQKLPKSGFHTPELNKMRNKIFNIKILIHFYINQGIVVIFQFCFPSIFFKN